MERNHWGQKHFGHGLNFYFFLPHVLVFRASGGIAWELSGKVGTWSIWRKRWWSCCTSGPGRYPRSPRLWRLMTCSSSRGSSGRIRSTWKRSIRCIPSPPDRLGKLSKFKFVRHLSDTEAPKIPSNLFLFLFLLILLHILDGDPGLKSNTRRRTWTWT